MMPTNKSEFFLVKFREAAHASWSDKNWTTEGLAFFGRKMIIFLKSSLMAKKTIKVRNKLVGGFNPSEKYESQLGLLFPIYGKS